MWRSAQEQLLPRRRLPAAPAAAAAAPAANGGPRPPWRTINPSPGGASPVWMGVAVSKVPGVRRSSHNHCPLCHIAGHQKSSEPTAPTLASYQPLKLHMASRSRTSVSEHPRLRWPPNAAKHPCRRGGQRTHASMHEAALVREQLTLGQQHRGAPHRPLPRILGQAPRVAQGAQVLGRGGGVQRMPAGLHQADHQVAVARLVRLARQGGKPARGAAHARRARRPAQSSSAGGGRPEEEGPTHRAM